VALLPKLLRAWAAEDLQNHLTRRRSPVELRQNEVVKLGKKARDLLVSILGLDDADRFDIAMEAQSWLEARDGSFNSPWVGLPGDPEAAERRQDIALLWLLDLADALDAPRRKPAPDKKTLGYLVVLDLAAIYEMVTQSAPTRRNWPNAKEGKRAYGPFWDFCSKIFAIIDIKSLDRAMKDVLVDYQRRSLRRRLLSSPFIRNLQFTNPKLWQVLR
jgi:hypothetical protein